MPSRTTASGKSGLNNPIQFLPGEKSTVRVDLRPIITTIKVITDPEEAFVEDVGDGGFGYLGTTPLTRNFTYEDILIWAETQGVGSRSVPAVRLKLKISKRGYEDVVTTVHIPVGEERSYVRPLQELVEQIHFSSDPAGASVFVERQKTVPGYPPSTYLEPLGTTPGVRTIEPAKRFAHQDKIIFKKSGFQDVLIEFIEGEYSYHVVMEPVKARAMPDHD